MVDCSRLHEGQSPVLDEVLQAQESMRRGEAATCNVNSAFPVDSGARIEASKLRRPQNCASQSETTELVFTSNSIQPAIQGALDTTIDTFTYRHNGSQTAQVRLARCLPHCSRSLTSLQIQPARLDRHDTSTRRHPESPRNRFQFRSPPKRVLLHRSKMQTLQR